MTASSASSCARRGPRHSASIWMPPGNRSARRADYPVAIMTLLGEASPPAALFTGHAKIDGRLSVQLRGEGALRTLFAECTRLRHAARDRGNWRRTSRYRTHCGRSGPNAILAITIENPSAGRPGNPRATRGWSSLTPTRSARPFEAYFRQFEQLPTRLLLGGRRRARRRADAAEAARRRRRRGRLEPRGRAVRYAGAPGTARLPAETLLTRLFHEDGSRCSAARPLHFACLLARSAGGLDAVSLGEDERRRRRPMAWRTSV